MIKAVLFDLDGTFADTAPDLAYALNEVLKEHDREPLSLEAVRLKTSDGSHALIKLGFGIDNTAPEFIPLRDRLIEIYSQNIAKNSNLFNGIEDLLDALQKKNISWGIVTNKPERLTNPLMDELGISPRTPCVVSGDTTDHAKPHPEPLIYGAKLLNRQPAECLYVGDAKRDIEAACNAGMKSLVALFGYISPDDQPDLWGADGAINEPMEVMDFILKIQNYRDHI
jgi:phosphoglycolate phosphatase